MSSINNNSNFFVTEIKNEVKQLESLLNIHTAKPKIDETISFSNFFSEIFGSNEIAEDKNAELIKLHAPVLMGNVATIESIHKELRALQKNPETDTLEYKALEKQFHQSRLAFYTDEICLLTLMKNGNTNTVPLDLKIAELEMKRTIVTQQHETIEAEITKELSTRKQNRKNTLRDVDELYAKCDSDLYDLLQFYTELQMTRQHAAPSSDPLGKLMTDLNATLTRMNAIQHSFVEQGGSLDETLDEFDKLYYNFVAQRTSFLHHLKVANLHLQFQAKADESPDAGFYRALLEKNDVLDKAHELALQEYKMQIRVIQEQNPGTIDILFEANVNLAEIEYQKILELQTWSSTSVGALLIEGNSSFEGAINGLLRQVEELHYESQNDLEPSAEREAQLNEAQKNLAYKMLSRIIDVLSEKQFELKTAKGPTDLIQADIELLNKEYAKYFKQYQELFVGDNSTTGQFLNSMKKMVTLGLADDTQYHPDEIRRKKQLADAGYTMSHALSLWNNLVKEKGIIKAAKATVCKFIDWAKDNPREALSLASDMALVCSIIRNENLLNMLTTQMRITAVGLGFESGWSAFRDQEEKPLSDEALMFYGISQLFKYAPVTTSIVKNLAVGEFSVKGGLTLLTEAITTLYTQHVRDNMTATEANLALQAIHIFKGESFQTLLEEQRNIELARLAGLTAAVVASPGGVLQKIKHSFQHWCRTLKASSGWELAARIATQITLPLFSTVGIAGLITVGVLYTCTLTMIATPTAAIAIAGVAIAVAYKTNSIYNRIFPSHGAVVELESEAQRKSIRDAVVSNQTAIEEQCQKYIGRLQRFKVLPIVSVVDQEAEQGDEGIKNEIINAVKVKLNTTIADLETPITAKDYVRVFIESGLNEVEAIINQNVGLQESVKTKQRLWNLVTHELMENWLKRRVMKAMTEQAVQFAVAGESPTRTTEAVDGEIQELVKNEMGTLDSWKMADPETKTLLDRQLANFFEAPAA
jgi:hypothetical protein